MGTVKNSTVCFSRDQHDEVGDRRKDYRAYKVVVSTFTDCMLQGSEGGGSTERAPQEEGGDKLRHRGQGTHIRVREQH